MKKVEVALVSTVYKCWPTLKRLLPFLLFLAIFIPRIIGLDKGYARREEEWMERSHRFFEALKSFDLVNTNVSYHPGVTTAWTSGIFLELNKLFTSAEAFSLLSVQNLAVARLGITLVTSLLILGIYFHLRRLFGNPPAIIATLFVAFDPFYLGYSRIVNTDGLFTGFLTLSILSLIVYLTDQKRPVFLIFSGLWGGLGVLTKSVAFVLIPYTFLTLSFYHLWSKKVWESRQFNLVLLNFLGFLGAYFFSILLFWPFLWELSLRIFSFFLPIFPFVLGATAIIAFFGTQRSPIKSPSRMQKPLVGSILLCGFCGGILWLILKQEDSPFLWSMQWAWKTPHEVSELFFGKVVADPGIFFFPVIFLFRTTPITFILFLGSVVYMLCSAKEEAREQSRWNLSYLLFFVLFFLVVMTLIAKKQDRYILPIFPIADILAGVTLYQIASDISKKTNLHAQKLTVGGSFVALIIHAAAAFSCSPYYFSYYNSLFGGTEIATKLIAVGRGEGMDLAAEYLNRQVDSDRVVTVDPQMCRILNLYLKEKKAVREVSPQPGDYVVLYILDVQRRNSTLVEEYYSSIKPEHVVQINGANFAWVYRCTH